MTSKPKPSFGSKQRQPTMKKIKTVWITQPTAPFTQDYRLGKQIGLPGQFGKAHQCQEKKTNRVYAVKLISKARFYRIDRDASRRNALLLAMKSEIDIMKSLKHRYIINLKTVYEDKHTLYVVMEECKGGELFDRITERKRFKEPDAAPIIKQILEALFFMHDKHRVVHCDLKPDNILFKTKKEDSDIKIIDFGMSKVLPRLRSLRSLCGTPYYTAPEILQGNYSHGADIWSVGVIMFVMLFGFPPFYVSPNEYYGRQETEAIYKLILKGFTPKVKSGYGPWFPKKFPVSDDAKDLMSKLIESNRANRLTAKDALQHQWIINLGKCSVSNMNSDDKKSSSKSSKSSFFGLSKSSSSTDDVKQTKLQDCDSKDNLNEYVVYQMANFSNNCKFKLAVIQIFQDKFKQMRPHQFKQLKNIFSELDKNGDGKISYEEFEEGMSKIKDLNLSKDRLREMFKELDVKSVGEIRFNELLNAAVHDYLVSSDERLYKAFRELDDDQDGVIDTDELKKKLKEKNTYGHYNDILKVIDDADLDNDNKINYEEFLRALHPNFNEQPTWFWEEEKT